jgi:predicted dehydrogenase
MLDVAKLPATVVGTGFIGVVHVDALRRIGVDVLGVVRATPERARAKAFPSFADGHRENLVAEAIAVSACDGRWVEVPQ